MIDTYRHKGMRKKLVDSIRDRGIIHDERILQAMEKIPRHNFLDSSFVEFAYQDKPFPIGNDQTISQPTTVAIQTQLLEIKKNDRILEIGTGSGYQASVLYEMGARVFSIERFKALSVTAAQTLRSMGYSGIKLFYGDGYKGLPGYAPFHKILVTAGAPYVPEELLKQLKQGGMLVIPVGAGSVQVMMRYTKVSDTEIIEEDFGDFSFVPMLKNKQ
ncbi:MAG: protein-L-isoaspartate(D-aspartate) O-methyltransferase [Bacteroidota bacterium]|nr:protein-L-isoaspartate(D-aspartate) O-methyltransferase [Bacteroidota bacterium]